jgi:hypothetical protein
MTPTIMGGDRRLFMTPAERALVTELFDRLATLEKAPRDSQAETLIREGSRRAPNALYSLVQTALVLDETLKQADARIQELERQSGGNAPPAREASFLDNMRDTLLGKSHEAPRAGSVPSVRSADAPANPGWGAPSGFQPGAQPMSAEPMRSGSSFLGNAAAAAAGMIGGSLLMNGMRGMMGGGHGHNAAALDPSSGSGAAPWGGSAAGGELSRQAGLDDIGQSPSSGDSGRDRGQGLFDTAGNDSSHDADADADEVDEDDDGLDDGGFDPGGGGDDNDVA